MFFYRYASQPVQSFTRVFCRQELIRIRSSFMSDRDGFSAPNQFRATAPESLPTSNRSFSRFAIWRTVPTLHEFYRDPIADFDVAVDYRPTQRRFRARCELSIARDIQMERTQVLLKTCDVLYGSEPKEGLRAHARSQSLDNNFIA